MLKYDVFLSHNSADKPAVEEVARRLVKEGIQPWLDPISPAERLIYAGLVYPLKMGTTKRPRPFMLAIRLP